jgi:hypothetical protein
MKKQTQPGVKKYISAISTLLLGSVISILGLELILQILPVKNTSEFKPNNINEPVLRAQTDILREPIDWKFSQTQHRKFNNYGFLDNNNFQPNTMPVAVIGDSYVQSSMLPYAETVTGRINARLGAQQIPVYSYGVPGYSLAGYVGTAEYVTNTFKPRAYVFIITKSDLDASLTASSGSYYLDSDRTLQFENGAPSRLKQLLDKSAIYRYTERQLRFDWEKILRENVFRQKQKQLTAANDPQKLGSERQQTANVLLDYLREKTSVKPTNTIFIIDTDRDYLYGRNPNFDRQELSIFREVAKAKGYRTIDTNDIFAPYYRTTRKQVDFLPTDFHWNAKGNELVADKLYPELRQLLSLPIQSRSIEQDI